MLASVEWLTHILGFRCTDSQTRARFGQTDPRDYSSMVEAAWNPAEIQREYCSNPCNTLDLCLQT